MSITMTALPPLPHPSSTTTSHEDGLVANPAYESVHHAADPQHEKGNDTYANSQPEEGNHIYELD